MCSGIVHLTLVDPCTLWCAHAPLQKLALATWASSLPVQGHLEHTSTVRWPYAVADDFFTKQLPNNVTWLLTLMYSLDQTGASRAVALMFWRLCWPMPAVNEHAPMQYLACSHHSWHLQVKRAAGNAPQSSGLSMSCSGMHPASIISSTL